MAIDGRIRSVETDGDDLIITIAPRVDNNKHLSLPGQRVMVIHNATDTPQPGQAIWGGSDFCRIEPLGIGETKVYRRKGSTTLIPTPPDASEA